MICFACRVEYPTSYAWCPRCGASLATIPPVAWDDANEVIEGTIIEYAATGDGPQAENMEMEVASDEGLPTIAHEATPSTSLVVARPALPSLPVRLWRQPAVRAVAQASAGALALTLGMRLLRGALTRPRATGQFASSALPVLRQMFDSRAPISRSSLPATSDDAAEIVETFIYMRRIVRRR